MLAPVLACLLSTLPETSRVTLYDGPARAEDKVTSMLVDAGGNAYLTGYSFGSGTDFDFCVVKVGSAGETLWTRRYGSPTNCEDRIWASVLDRDGNVVVCGGSILAMEQGWDWLVMKYSPQGESLWLRRLDFAEHGDDRPAGLAIAPDNSIVVTGTIRHRPDTTTKPAARTDWDAATVRFSPAGETLWTRLHDGGTRRDDQGVAVAADSGGNCYVAARTTAGTRGTDVSLLKYAPDGRLVWTRTVDGPARGNDFPTGLVIDRDGCPLVHGTVTGRGTSFDYFAALYDAAGNVRWQQTWDGAGRVDICQAAGFDSSGNVVLTGQSTGRGSSFDVATVCYTRTGAQRWLQRYNGPRNGADRGFAVACFGDRVFVGGSSDGTTGYPDLLVLGHSAQGDSLWSHRWCGGGTGESRVVGLAPSPVGLLVAGHGHRGATGFDYLLFCLRKEGF